MTFFWFCALAFLVTGYVLLDGYDLGTGLVHLFVARTDAERRQTIRTIGAVWDGNEVWLITAGGVMVLAFPALYASSFSGFYLPLTIVLWLLIMRGISLHFRDHFPSVLWRQFFDVGIAIASALLALFYGVALGNVVRGVPLDASGEFFLPLWVDFRVTERAGVLDWYTVSVGVLAVLALAEHGALWLAYRTDGVVRERSARLARRLWPALVAMVAVVTILTIGVQPHVAVNLATWPWGSVLPVLAIAGLLTMILSTRAGRDDRAFVGSALFIVAMLGSAAFGLYPYLLPSIGDPNRGITLESAAAGSYGLTVGMYWFIPGMMLVIGYTVFAHRKLGGRVSLADEAEY